MRSNFNPASTYGPHGADSEDDGSIVVNPF